MNSSSLEILKNFLQAYFHQDIDSPEKALQDLIEEESPEYLSQVVEAASRFLNSSLTKQEKNQLIRSHCDLYFPELHLTPIAWLESVVQQLKQK